MADRSGHVLVVDDDFLNLTLVTANLEKQGHAETAKDGATALAMLAESPYDVVLLDLLMPGIDGYEVLQHLKQDPAVRDIPVITLSSADELERVVTSIKLGAEDYLPKPFDPVLLRARLNACLPKKWFRNQAREYLPQVQAGTSAAAAVEAGAFAPEMRDAVTGRADALGQLARVVQTLACEVAAITDRDFFHDLHAQRLREELPG